MEEQRDRSELLRVDEVAKLLKVSDRTVYTLTKRGELIAGKVGGSTRWQRGAVEDYIEGVFDQEQTR